MSNKEKIDQEKLAEEWEKALAEEAQKKEESKVDEEKLAEEWAKALAEAEEEKMKKKQKTDDKVREFELPDLSKEMSKQTKKPKRDLEFILDIPLNVSAELGRSKLLINEILQLGQGSVIELDKLAGEPLEILVNGKLIARGEAVVINDKFGVRLTDIISPLERVKQLS